MKWKLVDQIRCRCRTDVTHDNLKYNKKIVLRTDDDLHVLRGYLKEQSRNVKQTQLYWVQISNQTRLVLFNARRPGEIIR